MLRVDTKKPPYRVRRLSILETLHTGLWVAGSARAPDYLWIQLCTESGHEQRGAAAVGVKAKFCTVCMRFFYLLGPSGGCGEA